MEQQEILQKLRAPFDIADHEARVLRESSNSKALWSIYIRREAITERLDELFGLEWEFVIDRIHDQMPNCITVTGSIIVNGKRRTNNGGATPNVDRQGNPTLDENTEKAAITDCFKRCASSWGIGLYLQNTPDIYTDSVKNAPSWEAKRILEENAMQRFADWLRTLTPGNIVDIEKAKRTLGNSGGEPRRLGSEPQTGSKATPATKTTPVGGNAAPPDTLAMLQNNSGVRNARASVKEATDTINKMWEEQSIHADMSDAEIVTAVVARLKRHRQPKTIGEPLSEGELA